MLFEHEAEHKYIHSFHLLFQAEKHQKRSIKLIIIFVLVVLIIAIAIGLILYKVLAR